MNIKNFAWISDSVEVYASAPWFPHYLILRLDHSGPKDFVMSAKGLAQTQEISERSAKRHLSDMVKAGALTKIKRTQDGTVYAFASDNGSRKMEVHPWMRSFAVSNPLDFAFFVRFAYTYKDKNPKKGSYPTQEKVALKLDMHPDSVKVKIKALKENGFLNVVRTTRNNVYWFATTESFIAGVEASESHVETTEEQKVSPSTPQSIETLSDVLSLASVVADKVLPGSGKFLAAYLEDCVEDAEATITTGLTAVAEMAAKELPLNKKIFAQALLEKKSIEAFICEKGLTAAQVESIKKLNAIFLGLRNNEYQKLVAAKQEQMRQDAIKYQAQAPRLEVTATKAYTEEEIISQLENDSILESINF